MSHVLGPHEVLRYAMSRIYNPPQSAYNMSWIVPDTMQSLYERLSTDRAFFNKTYLKLVNFLLTIVHLVAITI